MPISAVNILRVVSLLVVVSLICDIDDLVEQAGT